MTYVFTYILLLCAPGPIPKLSSNYHKTWDHSSPSLGSLHPPPWDHSSPSLGSLLPLPGITPPPPWDHCYSYITKTRVPFCSPPLCVCPSPCHYPTLHIPPLLLPLWLTHPPLFIHYNFGVVWTGDEAHAHQPYHSCLPVVGVSCCLCVCTVMAE